EAPQIYRLRPRPHNHRSVGGVSAEVRESDAGRISPRAPRARKGASDERRHDHRHEEAGVMGRPQPRSAGVPPALMRAGEIVKKSSRFPIIALNAQTLAQYPLSPATTGERQGEGVSPPACSRTPRW